MLKRVKHLTEIALAHQGFRRYVANTSWMFAEQILRMVAGLLVGIWVARFLGPEQFGIFSYAVAFAALFSAIAKLGLDSIVVRDLVRVPDQRDIYLGTAFWMKLVGAFAMLAAIAIVAQFTSNDATTNLYIFIIASGTIFQAFEVVDFYFQSKVLSRFVSICKLTQLLISSMIKLSLIFIHADLFWFVVVSLVDQLTLAAALFFTYRYQKLGSFYCHFDWVIAKQLLHDSWPLILSGLVIMIYMRIDQIMIKEMLGEKAVGIYSAAVRISEVWYFIPTLIANSLFPSIVNAKKASEKFYHTRLQRLYTFLLWMAVAIALPMTFMSNWLISFLYGDAFRGAGQVLMIHIWTGLFVALGVAQGKFWIVNNLQNKVMLVTATSSAANIILNIFLIPAYGVSGAAIATLVSYAIGVLIFPLFVKEAREMSKLTYKAFAFKVN